MKKIQEEKLLRLFKLLLKEAGPNDLEADADDEPENIAPANSGQPKNKPVAVPTNSPAPENSPSNIPPANAVSAIPANSASDAAGQVAIPGMDNDVPANANAAATDSEDKIRQAKVKLFFDNLSKTPALMNYLKFTNPLEQAEAIQRFAELVGVPRGQLVNVLSGIQQAATTPQTESRAQRILKLLLRESPDDSGSVPSTGNGKSSRRDTSWAVKQIEQFIADNEGIDQRREYGGNPSMRLNGAKPSKNFDITFDELRAIAKLLRRLGGVGKGGKMESVVPMIRESQNDEYDIWVQRKGGKWVLFTKKPYSKSDAEELMNSVKYSSKKSGYIDTKMLKHGEVP